MKHIRKIFLTILLIATMSITSLLTACNMADTSSEYYRTLLNNYSELKQKRATSKSSLRFSMYKQGAISSLEQELNMVKTLNNDDLLLAEGSLHTSKSDEMIQLIVTTFAASLKSQIIAIFPALAFDDSYIYDYFKGSHIGDKGEKTEADKIFFALGYGNRTFNLKGDYCHPKETPDYKVNDKNIFFGASEVDVLSFLKDNNIPVTNKKEVIDMLISAYEEIFPFEKMTANAKYISTEKAHLHTLKISDKAIKNVIRKEISQVIDTLTITKETKNIIDFIKTNTDNILSWFSFSDYILKLKVASSGELISISQDIEIAINIPEEDLLEFAVYFGISSQTMQGYIGLLKMMGLGSSDTNITNRFDFLIRFTNEEQFTYKNITLVNNDSFASSSTIINKRIVYKYVEDIDNPTKKIWVEK